MKAVGRDYIDNSVKTPFEQLIRDMERNNTNIVYKIKSDIYHIHLKTISTSHPFFHCSNYIKITIEERVGDELMRFILAAGKQAFPQSIIFVETIEIIIGTGPQGKMFISEGSRNGLSYNSLKEFEEMMYGIGNELEYETIHKYYINSPPLNDNKMCYCRGLNYFDKICLEAYVSNTDEFLFTNSSQWKIIIDGETEILPMYYTKFQQISDMLSEANKRDIKEIYLHKKYHTKLSFISFLCEKFDFEEIKREKMIPYNSIFSLYCQYAVYHCHDLLEHRNLYHNFVEIIKEYININHIYGCGSLPKKEYPKIYNILCAINYILEISNNQIERDNDELLEIGFAFSQPSEKDLQIILVKDTRYFLTLHQQNHPTLEQFLDWYKIMRKQYNETHPSPFLNRTIYSDDVLARYFEVCQGNLMDVIPHHFIDVQEELEKLLNVLESISPQQYFFDYLQTLLITTPLLLTHSNTVFNPSLICHSYFNREACDLSYDIRRELERNIINDNNLEEAFNISNSESNKSLNHMLEWFNSFEKRYFAFIDIEKRLPNFDIVNIINKLFQMKSSDEHYIHYEIKISLSEGIELFTNLGWTPEKVPNELEWTIHYQNDIRNEKAYYIKNQKEVRFSLEWID
ncbi:Hypothetical protein EHI5A_068660 [Entamoeba histolytica KU27]|uniref:Uncharacterized protein n=1 Tax=Entamoeba histolytica KU27 TaxID=885311 RepID=M2S1N0_ENTHI|nr:Hypothetical protein EHI5A_068660 [Entamoeba histolytica KU27]